MPVDILKGSIEYAIKNKKFFIYTLIIFFILEVFTLGIGESYLLYTSLFFVFMLVGYGLKVSQDVINGGTRLPTITLKELINFGLKGSAVYLFYILIQYALIAIISELLNFPDFDLEDIIVEFNETIHMILTHDIVSFIIFVLLVIVIVYVTMFFTKIGLGTLANGGSLRDAFNYSRMKRILNIIGLKEYVIDYTKLILSVVILLFINKFFDSYDVINIIVGIITDFLIFMIEFRGVGLIYKEYLELKSK